MVCSDLHETCTFIRQLFEIYKSGDYCFYVRVGSAKLRDILVNNSRLPIFLIALRTSLHISLHLHCTSHNVHLVVPGMQFYQMSSYTMSIIFCHYNIQPYHARSVSEHHCMSLLKARDSNATFWSNRTYLVVSAMQFYQMSS